MKKIDQRRHPWLWDSTDDNVSFETALSGGGVFADSSCTVSEGLADYDSSVCLENVLNTRRGIPLAKTRRAMTRLVEYAPESDLKKLLPLQVFNKIWPEIAGRIRSSSRRNMMEAIYNEGLPRDKHHEL